MVSRAEHVTSTQRARAPTARAVQVSGMPSAAIVALSCTLAAAASLSNDGGDNLLLQPLRVDGLGERVSVLFTLHESAHSVGTGALPSGGSASSALRLPCTSEDHTLVAVLAERRAGDAGATDPGGGTPLAVIRQARLATAATRAHASPRPPAPPLSSPLAPRWRPALTPRASAARSPSARSGAARRR